MSFDSNNTFSVTSSPVVVHVQNDPVQPLKPVETTLFKINDNPPGLNYSSGALEPLSRPMELDVDDLNGLLAKLQKTVTEQTAATGTQTIKLSAQQQREVTKKAQDAQTKANEKEKEAKDASTNSSVLNWVYAALAIVGVAAAALAVVGSLALGGWATAFTATVAVLAVTGAAMAIANAQVQDDKKMVTNYDGTQSLMSVSWSGMVDRIIDAQLSAGRDSDMGIVIIHKNGDKWFDDKGKEVTATELALNGNKFKTKDELADYKTGWSITAEVLPALIAIGAGFGAYKAAGAAANVANVASKGAELARTAAKAERIMEIVGGTADLAGSATSTYAGVKGIQVAEMQADSERARADKAFLDALLKDLGMRMKLSNDMVNQLVTRLNDLYDAMFTSLAASNRTVATIAHHMS